MRGHSAYANIEFAPFSEVPVDKEWARDRSLATTEPELAGGSSYLAPLMPKGGETN